ncbi:major facilitator superfamily domain-containing protein, partial [Gymnopilus junonius]
LPKGQLAILCFLRILDPLCFTQIFPYINEFMVDLHVTDDPTSIGFYSGIESAFACSQLLTIYLWGHAIDRFGRRPVVLVGAGGLAVTSLLFGLSTSFTSVILSRAIAGLFSGNVSVIPTILCEVMDESNQAFAFSFFGLWWPVGVVIGYLLSKPASRYPEYFDRDFFRVYPYFLPGFLVSCIAVFGFVIAWFFLKETLDTCQAGDQESHVDYGSVVNDSTGPVTHNYNIKQLLQAPIIRALCASGFALSFMSTAFDVLFVLFCFSPVKAGGLAFPASVIGFALSAAGGIAALLQVFFMPTILCRVSHASVYHFCMKLWPYTFLSLPLLNLIARNGTIPGTEQITFLTIAFLWVCIALILCLARVAFLAYTVNVLLVRRFALSPSSLGSTLGLVQFSICLARAFSPAFASSSFVFSADKDTLGRYSWVALMASLGWASSYFSKNIV